MVRVCSGILGSLPTVFASEPRNGKPLVCHSNSTTRRSPKIELTKTSPNASQAISLERQVRIAAGAIVVVGVVLAQFVHPLFMGLSAFVGCGLIFAGLTDRCGMGMLIAKAPWNQL